MSNQKVVVREEGRQLHPQVFTRGLNNTVTLNDDNIKGLIKSLYPGYLETGGLYRLIITDDGYIYPKERYNISKLNKASLTLASKYVANMIEWHLKQHVPDRQQAGEKYYGTSKKSLIESIGDLYLHCYLQEKKIAKQITDHVKARSSGVIPESVVCTRTYWHVLFLMN